MSFQAWPLKAVIMLFKLLPTVPKKSTTVLLAKLPKLAAVVNYSISVVTLSLENHSKKEKTLLKNS